MPALGDLGEREPGRVDVLAGGVGAGVEYAITIVASGPLLARASCSASAASSLACRSARTGRTGC